MNKPRYYISKNNEFVIENYNAAPTFSSFFPGIAGVYGIPMWVFYANRAQGITSAGIEDKDGAIMEFQPANKAYQSVAQKGFRTFLKVDGKFYEPFSEESSHHREMHISPHGLKLIEENKALKLKVAVEYFTLPGEDFPALARKLTITSLKKRKIELIDGLPVIIPFGFNNDLLKNISQTIEAWCLTENLENQAPFYKLKVMPADVVETKVIEKGNFFIPFCGQGPAGIIVDPSIVFGEVKSLEWPENFLKTKNFSIPSKQITEGIIPCAFAYKKFEGEEIELFSIIGQADSLKQVGKIKKKVSSKKYFKSKAVENKTLISDLCSLINTQSASKPFDLYTRQTFLDNIMRGGLPLSIDGKVIYLYFRKHGDMERDYNNFKLMPTHFSQGTGNYRDINQNRRCDIFFNPEVAEDNIIRFVNLIQLDGFNPLVVLGGQDSGAIHGEGFWIDHAFYNTDLLESFECLYPEKIAALLFDQKTFSFFDNDHIVAARENKYHLVKGRVRQRQSVLQNSEKQALILNRGPHNHVVRTNFGKGQKYYTTLAAKILCLIANKAASFDAQGIGLEMEAGKPDWYDALNGLPALLGSSLSETLELKRICQYLLRFMSDNRQVTLALEIKSFIGAVNEKLINAADSFAYWEQASFLKEKYREKTKFGLSGKEITVSGRFAADFLKNVIERCDRGIKKCLKKYKNYYTYFINEVVDFEKENGSIKVKGFKQTPLPLFLEGFVHALKVEKDTAIYSQVKKSPLYDKKLKMYKVNAPLDSAPAEIGRCKIFTPGWLENESIWLHMEYKYMLELLKAGLHKEFFAEMKNVFIPFIDPKVYKRSTLENSSFIVSSANPNQNNHGRGFVARLSGAAAEFVDMWIIMTTGKKIFYLGPKGKLCFKLSPILPAWLFDKGKFGFKLLGAIDVTYINKKGKNTFDGGVSPSSYKLIFDDKEIEINDSFIKEPYSGLIRDRKVKKIIVTLA